MGHWLSNGKHRSYGVKSKPGPLGQDSLLIVMGYILLEGGAEFGGRMADPDRRAIALAGGPDETITIIPAAAAPDNNHQRAGKNGVGWFQGLGATNVSVLPLIDRSSANDPAIVEALAKSRLTYLLGGFPHYLSRALSGSLSWQAMLTAYLSGAVIAGSSAGAMVLCEYYYDPVSSQVVKGLNLVEHICILPHHNTYGKDWVPQLKKQLPDIALVGIDEETGALKDASQDDWRVYGKGKITLYHSGHVEEFEAEQEFTLDKAVRQL
jgi:cyanophycinase